MPVNEFLDGDEWIMRSLPDDFFLPERSGGEHLTDEMIKERFDAIPKEYQETARFIHTVLLTLHQKMKVETVPCLVARIAIFEVNKELEKKTGYLYPIPFGWYTDAVMIDPEWIVRITNGLVKWEGDESCIQCGRDDCRFYIPRKNDPKSGAKYSMYRRGEKRPTKGKWKKESKKHG
jgi:hypothetical protein